MLNQAQLTTAMGRMAATPQPMVLFHGTNTAAFYSKVCMRSGFTSNQMFMGAYSLQSLGGTSIYGPGIYLANTRAEAANYGSLIIRFEFESTTDYMDLTGVIGTQHAQAVGVPKQNLLAESRLYGLLRVTNNYYVMRTCYNCVVGPG